jgi:hypothetical protein
MPDEDYVEVWRVAHELRARMGRDAYEYAARLAAEALEGKKLEEHEFWRRVESALTPR